MKTSAPRLFVFLAREASIGVILRRGPAAWVQLSVWRTDRDIFAHGQWMKARVYEDRCDVAPDGSLFLYFTRKGTPTVAAAGYGDAWTAISKPPYFTALALWSQRGTYFGGGVFEDNRTVRLNGTGGASHPDHRPEGITVRGARGAFVDGWSYIERLQRDGWQTHGGWPPAKEEARGWLSVASPPSVWYRPNPRRTHMLMMSYTGAVGIGDNKRLPGGFGGYAVKLAVNRDVDGSVIELRGATWADWDQQGRLVLAKEGKLFAWEQSPGDEGTLRELIDFTPFRPEPTPSPDWAHTWQKRQLRILRSGLRYV